MVSYIEGIVKPFAVAAGVTLGSAVPAFANDDGDRLGNVVRYLVGDNYVFNPSGMKEPHPDKQSVEGLGTEGFGRESVSSADADFNYIAAFGNYCTSSFIYVDESLDFPEGTYVLTSAHCTHVQGSAGYPIEKPEADLIVFGSYLDNIGVEQRYVLRDPFVYTPEDYSQVNHGQTSKIQELANEVSIIYFPNQDLPDAIVPQKFIGFDGDPHHIVGNTLHTAGYDSRLFGLSHVKGGCEALSVGDVIAPFGADSTLINVIDTNCSVAPRASGSPVETIIDGENVVVGVVSASFLAHGRGYVSYLGNDHLGAAAELFNSRVNDGAIEMVADSDRLCNDVIADTAPVYAEPGAIGDEVASLKNGDIVEVFNLDGGLNIAAGKVWASVIHEESGVDGFVNVSMLGDEGPCHEFKYD